MGGLSMGAFGAANLALKHPELVGTAAFWSGYFEANTPNVEGTPGGAGWRRDSPIHYVPGMIGRLLAEPLNLSFYVGRDDDFYRTNVAFERELTSLGVPHTFAVYPGGHSSILWRAELPAQRRWIGAMFTASAPGRPPASAAGREIV